MPLFRRDRALSRRLPLVYEDVCARLVEFDAKVSALRASAVGMDNPSAVADLHRAHDEMLAAAAEVLDPDTTPELTSDAHLAFVLGVLALHHYSSTAVGRVPPMDSVGSRTLPHFRADWEADVLDEFQLRTCLERAFSIGEGWEEVDLAMSKELRDLELRHQIMESLNRRLPVDSEEGVYQLFEALYPNNPFIVGDVGLVRTGTSLFFCIPYSGEVLDVSGYHERTEEDRRQVEAFLKSLRVVYQEHFPVFGFFRGEQARPGLIQGIAAELGETPAEIASVLTTMVSILRSADIDKYLVHDVWGHQWQAHLFPFEDHYKESGGFRRLPALEQEVRGEDGWRGSLGSCLEQGARWLQRDGELTAEYWDPYISAIFVERLMVCGALSVSELLADVSEYKLHVQGGEGSEYLASSSYFPLWPTKFDLTLMDARVMFDTALEGFKRFTRANRDEPILLQRLLLAYPELDASCAAAAVESFRKRVAQRLSDEFHSRIEFEADADGVRVNPFTRMCLNLLGLHRGFNELYARLSASERKYPSPLLDFRDLLLMSIGAFYFCDPQHNFWHLDEYIAHCFEECLEQFCCVLEESFENS